MAILEAVSVVGSARLVERDFVVGAAEPTFDELLPHALFSAIGEIPDTNECSAALAFAERVDKFLVGMKGEVQEVVAPDKPKDEHTLTTLAAIIAIWSNYFEDITVFTRQQGRLDGRIRKFAFPREKDTVLKLLRKLEDIHVQHYAFIEYLLQSLVSLLATAKKDSTKFNEEFVQRCQAMAFQLLGVVSSQHAPA